MDQTRTKETLDALADLFLTGSTGVVGEASANIDHTDESSNVAAPAPTMAPMRLPPKPAVAAPVTAMPEPEPDEVVGVIGPRGESPGAVRPRAKGKSNLVEAVFLGNLPGFGRPWLTQYAHWLAQSQGPVAVLHVNDDGIEIEMVGLRDDPLLLIDDINYLRSARQAKGQDLLDTLHELVQLPNPVSAWLIHLPTPPTSFLAATALDLPRWTILSGADDAAVVSAYRLLKDLLCDDPHADSRRVRLMIMGSDEFESRNAARKLNATAGSFLDTPVGLVGSIKQMTPVGQRVLGSVANTDRLWPSVRALIEVVSGRVPSHDPLPPLATKTEPLEVEPMLVNGSGHDDRDGPTPRLDPATEVLDDGGTSPQEAEPLRPAVKDTAVSGTSAPSQGPDLVTYLSGALSLEARCPAHPGNQLALDERGQIQLLCYCDCGHDLHEAIVDLMATSAWAREHVELLQLTQRQCRIDQLAEPVMHLFTNDAKAAVTLARNRPQLRLHLLQSVAVGDRVTWCCNDLN